MVWQGLELRLAQKQALALTPQLLQAIRVLGMTRTELETYVETELENNPALEASWDEKGEAVDWAEYLSGMGAAETSYGSGVSPVEFAGYAHEEASLRDFLVEQISTACLARISKDAGLAYALLCALIESLDENGFLTQSVAETAAQTKASEREVAAAIEVLQGFEPPGVAAKDVRDALALQYRRAGGREALVFEIIEERLADVAVRSAAAVARRLGRKRQEVEAAFALIAELNPKPGRGFSEGGKTIYIVPDIVVEKTAAGYEAHINCVGVPALTVSPYYRKILSETEKGSEAYMFLDKRLHAAASLIKTLEQRKQTMYNITIVILRRQRAFFDEGEAFLEPMTLRQVAEEVGVHESTVSRAVRGKYVQTPRGMFEMRRFFGAGIRSAGGAGVRAENVKARIAVLVLSEDKRAPLSDRALAERLGTSGIFVSRRTVAKYRDETGIPPAAKRARK